MSHSKPDDAHRPAAENPRKCSKDQEGIGVLRETERASKQQTGQRGAEGSPQPRLGGRRCRDVRHVPSVPRGVWVLPESRKGFGVFRITALLSQIPKQCVNHSDLGLSKSEQRETFIDVIHIYQTASWQHVD